MPSVYKMVHDDPISEVLEDMRLRLSNGFGVTQVGNRVTLRWYKNDILVDVHMIIESVMTPIETIEQSEKTERYQKMIDKYKKRFLDLESELYFAEHGEYPK